VSRRFTVDLSMEAQMKQQKHGKCHICGEEGPLTYEHVPPKAAFNSHKAFMTFGMDVIGEDRFPWDFTEVKGVQHQRGFGFHTLCPRCNNNTGSWYGPAFVDFIYKGYLETYWRKVSTGDLVSIRLSDIYPLRVVKQLVAMFFSVNNPDLSTIHEDVRAFVLSRERRGIEPARYGLYVYVLRGEIRRYIGLAGILSTSTGRSRLLSELSAPPFGFVLEIDPKEKSQCCDLGFMANEFDYEQKRTIDLEIPVYESNTYFPADYRTKRRVMEDYVRNKLLQLRHAPR
jgi:hypothetical protein